MIRYRGKLPEDVAIHVTMLYTLTLSIFGALSPKQRARVIRHLENLPDEEIGLGRRATETRNKLRRELVKALRSGS